MMELKIKIESKNAPAGTLFDFNTIWHGRHSVPTAGSFLQETVSI